MEKKSKKRIERRYKCVVDDTTLDLCKTGIEEFNGEKEVVRFMKCDKCGRLFAGMDVLNHGTYIKINGTQYIVLRFYDYGIIDEPSKKEIEKGMVESNDITKKGKPSTTTNDGKKENPESDKADAPTISINTLGKTCAVYSGCKPSICSCGNKLENVWTSLGEAQIATSLYVPFCEKCNKYYVDQVKYKKYGKIFLPSSIGNAESESRKISTINDGKKENPENDKDEAPTTNVSTLRKRCVVYSRCKPSICSCGNKLENVWTSLGETPSATSLHVPYCSKCNNYYLDQAKYQKYGQYFSSASIGNMGLETGNTSIVTSRKKTDLRDIGNIDSCDFVVKRATFRCLHNDHELMDIKAGIDVIDKKGSVQRITVTAGYCRDCNIYFILDSSYRTIRNIGIPICKVIDEKTYLSDSKRDNTMKLAKQSVLMQYGYNVNRSEDLTEKQRRKILSFIIDNNILSRSDVVSYINFFINQRKNKPNMEEAIAKWTSDKSFIEQYNIGSLQTRSIKSIRF